MNQLRRKTSFTLVELIVAMTLTVLVTGSTVGILRSITASRERLDLQMTVQQEARMALSAIATALRNAHRTTEGDWVLEGTDDLRDGVPNDRIRFFAISRRTIRRKHPESDVRECEFFLHHPEGEPLPILFRRTDPTRNEAPDGGGIIEPIAHHLVGMDIAYHDGLEWRNDWPKSTRGWPAAIRVRLIVMGDAEPPLMWPVSRIVNFPYRPRPEQREEQ